MHATRSTNRHGGAGAVLVLAVVLIALVALIGWARGWFTLAVKDDDRRAVEVKMTLDKQRAREDAHQALSEARQLGEEASVVAGIKSAEGTVVNVSPSAETLTIRTGDSENMAFRLDAASEIVTHNEQAPPGPLAPGQLVVVTYRQAGGVNRALKVSVSDESS